MAGEFHEWSTTASSNDTADSAVNWAEGQLPSTVNNSARAMMASTAAWRDDNNGTKSLAGSSNTYTLASPNGTYAALATGLTLGVKANHTNTGAATLNLSSLGAKAIRVYTYAGDSAVSAGMIIADGHYNFRYDAAANSAAGAWILLNPSIAGNITSGTNDGGSVGVSGNAFSDAFWASGAVHTWSTDVTLTHAAAAMTWLGASVHRYQYADDTASAGPFLTLYRTSASPAASDALGSVRYSGQDSGGNETVYVNTVGEIVDHTDGSEDGRFRIATVIAGTLGARAYVGNGFYTVGATGGDQGANTINASAYYDDGVALPSVTAMNAFAGALLHVQDQATSGTDGPSLTDGTWNKIVLDTEVTDELTVTITSGVIALAAGTYIAEAFAAWHVTWGENAPSNLPSAAIRLRDTTNSVTLARGPASAIGAGSTSTDVGGGGSILHARGKFTLSGTANVELQMYAHQGFSSGIIAGRALTTGENEVHADIMIWKVG